MSVLPGFAEGHSDNLPKIDCISMFSFLAKNPDFMGTEIQGIKAKRSGLESYGDNAVGYVQVKKDSNFCTVKAKITPHHIYHQKAYDVTLLCNELDEEVIFINCDDCTASVGGCKHAIALLTWLHRRSEEPADTPVSYYWKNSELSTAAKIPKFIKAEDLGNYAVKPLRPSNGSFLNAVIEHSKREGIYDTVLTKYFKEPSGVETISLHYLFINFLESQHGSTAGDFLNYCSFRMSEAVCSEIANKTVLQHESALWHKLRYGRISASKAHEVAYCHLFEEYFTEEILGVVLPKDSAAIKRRQAIRRLIEKEINIKINLCGLHTSAKYPVMGVSPDGISNDYVIEIKCSTADKPITYYVENGEVKEKYKAQIQLQMFFCKKKQGLFCVADMDFEKSKKLSITIAEFDEQYCLDILEKCTAFWKKSVFSMMKRSHC